MVCLAPLLKILQSDYPLLRPELVVSPSSGLEKELVDREARSRLPGEPLRPSRPAARIRSAPSRPSGRRAPSWRLPKRVRPRDLSGPSDHQQSAAFRDVPADQRLVRHGGAGAGAAGRLHQRRLGVPSDLRGRGHRPPARQDDREPRGGRRRQRSSPPTRSSKAAGSTAGPGRAETRTRFRPSSRARATCCRRSTIWSCRNRPTAQRSSGWTSAFCARRHSSPSAPRRSRRRTSATAHPEKIEA